MKRHADKLTSGYPSHSSCKPAAPGTRTVYPLLPEPPLASTPLVSELPFTEIEGVLYAMARIMEQRDRHTAGHCERLAFSSVALGVALGLDSASLLSLYVGGFLHDIGKIGMPDSVLLKPDKLTPEEWTIMRTHPERGEAVCRPLTSLRGVLPLIRSHHEKWDGTGYPDGLRGTEIPFLARVLQVVDIYDALTNPRPYKQAYSSAHALDILREETDRGWRDKDMTDLFIRVHEQMPGAIAHPPGGLANLAMINASLRDLQTNLAQ